MQELLEQRKFILEQIEYMTETLDQYKNDLKELDELIASQTADA